MHEDREGHIHVNQEEASGGSKEGVVRWVLIIGLLLAIILLSVTWIGGALTNNPYEEEGDVSGRIQAAEKDAEPDGMVAEEFVFEPEGETADEADSVTPETPASEETEEPAAPDAN